jgi:hypothetical protein
MVKPWDNGMKRLLAESPQDFLDTILLWNISYRELMDRGLPGILPLVPLARGGADREVIEEVIALLMPMEESVKRELLALTLLFASLAFERSEDQEWIRRKFEMLKDILRGTPAYQYIYEEGREEEHQKHLRSLQQKILEIVQKRYPRLAKLAQKQVVGIVQTELLEDLLIKVAMAPTPEEVQNALLSSDDERDA